MVGDPLVAQRKAQQQVLIGAGLVVLGCVFGGLLAVVFNLIGLRLPAGIAAVAGGVLALIGVGMQIIAFMAIRSQKRGGS